MCVITRFPVEFLSLLPSWSVLTFFFLFSPQILTWNGVCHVTVNQTIARRMLNRVLPGCDLRG